MRYMKEQSIDWMGCVTVKCHFDKMYGREDKM